MTLVAGETGVVPVSVLVGQIARIYSDGLLAVLAGVGQIGLVALDTVGLLLFEHISLAGQIGVAMSAQEVVNVEVLIHGLQVFV